MPYALPEDSFLHSKNSPQNRRRHRHGRSPSRTGYSCGSSSFPWCAPFPLPGSDPVVCDFSTFNGKSKWSFCTKFSPYSPVSLSYPPPPREYRPAPCGESTQTQRSPSDVYSRIVYTLYEVQTTKSPKVQIKWSKRPSVFVHYAEKPLFLQIGLTFLKEVV